MLWVSCLGVFIGKENLFEFSSEFVFGDLLQATKVCDDTFSGFLVVFAVNRLKNIGNDVRKAA